MVDCRPSSLAMLLVYIISKFTVAPEPLAQPSIWRFHLFWAAGFVQESSQRSSNISCFDHVQFACESTQSKFEPRFCERESLSSILPSVSGLWRYLIHLAGNGDSKSSPNDTTYWAPYLRIPHLSWCGWDMLRCWRRPCWWRPCGVPWSPTSSSSSWGLFLLCPLVRDGVPLVHAYSYFSSSPALSLRSFLLSFHFPHMLGITLACCAVYPSLVRFPLPLPWPSWLVFIRIPFPFGNFLGFLAHPLAL